MENNADNAFPDLLSAALSESGLTDDLEDWSNFEEEAQPQIAAQPQVVAQPQIITQPQTFTVQPRAVNTQTVYQPRAVVQGNSVQYIQQPLPRGTTRQTIRVAQPRGVQVTQARGVAQGRGVAQPRGLQVTQQRPGGQIIRLAAPGTSVAPGTKTVRLVTSNPAASQPNVKRIIIKTVPSSGGQSATPVTRVIQTPGGTQAKVIQTIPAASGGQQQTVVKTIGQQQTVVKTIGQQQTVVRTIGQQQANIQGNVVTVAGGAKPGYKVIKLATKQGGQQGNMLTLPSSIKPGVPVRIVPVRAGPGGLTTGPSTIVTDIGAIGTGPASVVTTAKPAGSTRVVTTQRILPPVRSLPAPQPVTTVSHTTQGLVTQAAQGLQALSQGTQGLQVVTQSAQGLQTLSQGTQGLQVVTQGLQAVTHTTQGLQTVSQGQNIVCVSLPQGSSGVPASYKIVTLSSTPSPSVAGNKAVTATPTTPAVTLATQTSPASSFQQSFIKHLNTRTPPAAKVTQVKVTQPQALSMTQNPPDASKPAVVVQPASASIISSVPVVSTPAVMVTAPQPVIMATVGSSVQAPIQTVKTEAAFDDVKIPVAADIKPPVAMETGQAALTIPAIAMETGQAALTVPAVVKQEIKSEPQETKPEISQITVPPVTETVPIETKPVVKAEPKDELLSTDMVAMETDEKVEVKSEPVVKQEEPTATKPEILEPAEVKKEEPAPAMDFGSMLGGDGADNPFFMALAQLQDTNKKAAEFEKEVKAKAVEPEEKPAETTTESKPDIKTEVSQTPGTTSTMLDTPGVSSMISTSSTTGIASTSYNAYSLPGTLSEPISLLQRSDSPVSLLQRSGSPVSLLTRSGSPVSLVQRSGSPVSLLQRSGSPLVIQQRSGSPIITTQRVGSPHTQILPGGILQTGTTASGRLIPAGTKITVQPGGVTTNAASGNRIVVGNSNHGNKVVTVMPGYNGMVKKELTEKDVSRIWSNEDLKLKKLKTMVQTPQVRMTSNSPTGFVTQHSTFMEDVDEDEEEELGQAETYSEYMPPKLKIGCKHPDPVVETSSLSSVEPQDVHYTLSIPESTIDYGSLSAAQLETVVYSCQKHDTYLPSGERAGFLIGDGAGVGKGRTIAGIIFENYLHGRKRALWLSVSNDLRVDAERDLRDIGASKIDVHPLNKFKYAKISSHINGSVKKGVIFATYSSLIGESHSGGKYKTRLKQLTHWLDRDFDGVIVFDECHRAKNLFPAGSSKPTKTGMTVLELQNRLPKARIVYASATGASEPRHMAYMVRLGLWGKGTPFKEFNDFIQAVEKRGVGAMELVAMDMKLRGMYIARQLSFKGVSFRIEEIPIAKDFVHIYNEAVKLWVDAREKFQTAAELIDAEHRMKKTMWGQFWSAHQRFFKYLCISAKVRHCVKLAREAVKNGKCVVIGLQSTGEARTLEQLEEADGVLTDFVSTAKGVIQTLVEKHFPAPDRSKTAGLFGLGSSIFDSPLPSPKYNTGGKRKKETINFNKGKKARRDISDDSDEDSDSSASKKSSSESELSLSESEEDSDSEEEDFNPFGNGSDSDDDPWLKKSKAKAKKKEKKKKEKEKEKKKKKEDKKKKKKKKKKSDDSDDEFDDIDKKFDEALFAAGLKGEVRESTPLSSMINAPRDVGKDAVERAISMKRELLEKIERLGDLLPPNTLDELIDSLGGPDNVAEMTGRKGRVVSTNDGVQYESRSEVDAPLEILNLTEKQRFMDGEKYIAIISEAASSGISLQADRRASNQRRRVHITLELPWSADRAIQQFGRTHRSNQVSAPEYIFLISELAGERRFAATVAKRLESLGALTHGDRRATESRDLSRFNIDNKYGRTALEAVMKSVLQIETPLVPPPGDYPGHFYSDVKTALIGVGMINYDSTLEKDYNNISKFLNRILGTPVVLQNLLFKYFTDTLGAIILQAKRNGRWDLGILDLGSHGEAVKLVDSRNFHGNFSGARTRVTMNTINVERGMTWMEAMEKWREYEGSEDGFYIYSQENNGKRPPILAVGLSGRRSGRERLYAVFKPNTGRQLRSEPLSEIKKKYTKVYPDDARYHWEDQYDSSTTICSHAYWKGSCKRASVGLSCETGLRSRTYYVLSGSVLSVWNKVESVMVSIPGGHTSRMQIIRLRTEEGKRIVGTLVPANAVKAMIAMLSQDTSGAPSTPFPRQVVAPGLHHSVSAPILHQGLSHHHQAAPLGVTPLGVSQPLAATRPPIPQYTQNPRLLGFGAAPKPRFQVVTSPAAPAQQAASSSQETAQDKPTQKYISMPMFL